MTTALDAHVEELGRVLRGPAGVRHDMLREVRDGLTDAADAHAAAGLDDGAAATRAIDEFGTVAELAAQYQAELTARQGRATALYVAITFPAMVLGWALLWRNNITWGSTPDPGLQPTIRLLSTLVDTTALGCAAAAVVLFGLTYLRGVPPRLVTGLVGAVAGMGALATSGMSVAMNVAGGRVVVTTLAEAAAAVPAYAISFAMLVVSLRQAFRTVRTTLASRTP